MAEPTLYLFDGHNILHAGGFHDAREVIDRLAGWVALKGARGIVVFDGSGETAAYGALEVRFASPADAALERLAVDHRADERVCIVSSDRALRHTAGQEVAHLSARLFLRELRSTEAPRSPGPSRSSIEDALDEETRKTLERWRRTSR